MAADMTALAWFYSHEVQLEVTLHLDVQTTLETSDTADLDNYAKAILDRLKGPRCIMFDDTQVQALGITVPLGKVKIRQERLSQIHENIGGPARIKKRYAKSR